MYLRLSIVAGLALFLCAGASEAWAEDTLVDIVVLQQSIDGKEQCRVTSCMYYRQMYPQSTESCRPEATLPDAYAEVAIMDRGDYFVKVSVLRSFGKGTTDIQQCSVGAVGAIEKSTFDEAVKLTQKQLDAAIEAARKANVLAIKAAAKASELKRMLGG